MNPLIISTLPHYISIYPVYVYYTTDRFICTYINIIAISTTFSVLYHFYNESNAIITGIDYYMVFVWFLYDLTAGTRVKKLSRFLLVNAVILFININVPYNKNYIVFHSLWHCLSAYKCYYVSNQIRLSKELLIEI